jgi:hypothetical protein
MELHNQTKNLSSLFKLFFDSSFVAVFFTAGTQTLTIQDTANGLLTASVSVAVHAASASHFVITAPSAAVSGNPFDLTLTAFDLYGNVDMNNTGTVRFTSTDTDPGVILPANYTFQSTDSGMHAFAAGVTLITLGDQILTATDTANGITGNATIMVGGGNAPPPGGRASPPSTPPGKNTALAASQSGLSAQQAALVDRFFGLARRW